MFQLILKSHLALLFIPLLTMAIEPNNPTELCDRFIGDKDKASCIEKASQKDLDWYAASACGQQEDDQSFLSCLDEVKGGTFNPQALELCTTTGSEVSDGARISCLRQLKNKDYTRAQLKKCTEEGTVGLVTRCLQTYSQQRSPASNRSSSGFQSLEVSK